MNRTPQALAFIDYLYHPVAQAIEAWDDETARDIYVVWLMLSLTNDDSRFVEISSVGYNTNTHTTAELAKSYGSKWSPGCWAGGTDLNLCHPSDAEYVAIYGIEDKDDPHGRALRDAYLDAAMTRFDRSDEQHDAVFEHSNLQYRLNNNPAEFSHEEQARLEELNQRFGVSEAEREMLQEDNRFILGLYSDEVFNPFIAACGAVIQRLHSEGVLQRKCGQAVPVGITFSNDVDARVALQATRNANPPGLSRGVEEWMMGRTYEQLDGEQELLREVTAKTPHEQAYFWAQALLEDAESLYLDKTTPLVERLHSIGWWGMRMEPLANSSPEVAAQLVSLLVPLIEERASAHPRAPYVPNAEGPRGDANEVATSLLSAVQRVGTVPRHREVVREEDVERLHQLLARLFRESESLERVGLTTALVARALHALRPHRFPVDKFGGGGETANRLLNYRDFGLVKSDPNTPDYDEAADEARRAIRRLQRAAQQDAIAQQLTPWLNQVFGSDSPGNDNESKKH
jgi:hypothetical protein